jgi:hypothetical protein
MNPALTWKKVAAAGLLVSGAAVAAGGNGAVSGSGNNSGNSSGTATMASPEAPTPGYGAQSSQYGSSPGVAQNPGLAGTNRAPSTQFPGPPDNPPGTRQALQQKNPPDNQAQPSTGH